MKQLFLIFNLFFVIAFVVGCASQISDDVETTEASAASEIITTTPNFSGYWEIDYKLTENPRDKLQWLYEVSRAQADQLNRRDKGRGSSLQTIKAIDDLNDVILLGNFTEVMTRSNSLKIEQSEGEIIVEREGDFALTCDLTTRFQKTLSFGEERCGIDANGDLIFVVGLPEGLTVMNRMVMSKDGRRLNVATTFASNRLSQPFTLNRVYMPYELGGDAYKCEYSLARKNVCWLGSEDESHGGQD